MNPLAPHPELPLPAVVAAAPALLAIVFFPGLMIAAQFPPASHTSRRGVLRLFAESAAAGVPAAMLAGWVLAEANALSLGTLAPLMLLLGLVLWALRRVRLDPVDVTGAALLFAAAVAGVMLLPARGEWLAGGQDQGLYANAGFFLARTGGAAPIFSPALCALPEDIQGVMLRDFGRVVDAFTGIPVDPATGLTPPPMFRGTPVWIAIARLCGGPLLGLRATELAGWLSIAVLWAALRAMGLSRPRATVAAGLLALQPIFLYHLHTPCSEIPELLLAGAAMLGHARRTDHGPGGAALAAAALFAATLNRVSFALFGAMLVAGWALAEAQEGRRIRRLAPYALYAVALAAGVVADVLLTPTACARLWHVLPRIFQVSGVLLAFALGWVASGARLPASWSAPPVRVRAAMALLVAAAMAVLLSNVLPPLGEIRHNLLAVAPFIGWGLVAAAGVGLVAACLAWRLPRLLVLTGLAVAGTVLMVLEYRHMAERFPWATKRYLPFMAPMVATLASLLVARLPRVGWAASAALVLALVAGLARPGWRAWRGTEYHGLWEQMDTVARQVRPGDIVVADHFKWGTPLKMTWGVDVVNGERLWVKSGHAKFGVIIDLLARRAAAQGGRLLWLTSTKDALGLYPWAAPPQARRLAAADPWAFDEVINSERCTRIEVQRRQARFALYELAPDDPAARPGAGAK